MKDGQVIGYTIITGTGHQQIIEGVAEAIAADPDWQPEGPLQIALSSELSFFYQVMVKRDHDALSASLDAVLVAELARKLLLLDGYDGPCMGDEIRPLMEAVIAYDKTRPIDWLKLKE